MKKGKNKWTRKDPGWKGKLFLKRDHFGRREGTERRSAGFGGELSAALSFWGESGRKERSFFKRLVSWVSEEKKKRGLEN